MTLPTDYQTYIATSRYARYLEEEQRRETWEETVERYMDFLVEHLQSNFKYDMKGALYKELYIAIRDLEVMPSMRALMTSGVALNRDNICGYNCFSGETEFMTPLGNRTLKEVYEEGGRTKVLTADGEWRTAEIKNFGKQKLQKITLRPGGRSNTKLRWTVYATENHRWITTEGETTSLKEGMCIPFNGVPVKRDDNIESFVRGLLYADGTIDARGQARIRLCGDKNRFLHLFEEVGNCRIYTGKSLGEDNLVVFSKGFFTDCKQIPKEVEYEWFSGYIAGDGTVDPRQPTLSTQDREAVDYLFENSAFGGFAITGHSTNNSDTNYGPRSAPLNVLGVRDDIVFRVVSIEETEREEEVYCAVEPVTKSFTLSKGILTGNCAYLPVDHPRAFDEALYILMCGTGVGFSVERQYVGNLPEVSEHFESSDTTIHVADSKSGWARSFKELISMLYSGQQPKWDLSKLRPAGAKLKTFGGRSSGPDPLNDLFNFTVQTFKEAAGRRLTSIECHDIMCKVGEVVVVGGVRRSAMISLSNLSDDRMRHAKSGQWWDQHGYRALANNSVCYSEKPDMGSFMREWESLYDSKSGERGIFNRAASRRQAEKNGRRDSSYEFGTNPCSEIILRPNQFCNLSEVVVRPGDDFESLQRKVRIATILGTFQSTLTNFKYLRKVWKDNTEEERLLGVSLTGIMDNPLTFERACISRPLNKDGIKQPLSVILTELKETAIETNKELADVLQIPHSTSITCVKPSGTVSQLVDSASGIHPRYSSYYIRTVRGDLKDPLTQFLIEQGVPNEPALGQEGSTVVFSFPHSSPDGVVTRDDGTALDQLRLWLTYQRHWCEHKPSITVYVREDEWMEVGAFVYEHFDEMSGVSFLPYDNGTYRQAPYQEITEEEYEALVEEMPVIDWDSFTEEDDNTIASQELACTGGTCEIL